MEQEKSLFEWHHALTGAVLRTVGSGVKIQLSGKQYLPDRVEHEDASADGKTRADCYFSEAGLLLRLMIETTENRLDFSGTLYNHADKPIPIEQLWLGESMIALGGCAENYRVYYNSGCQESSGTCSFSAIRRATETAKANLDPEDPDAVGIRAIFVSTCIQPGYVRSQYLTAVYSKKNNSAVCLGSTSFNRAETVFFLKPGTSEQEVLVSPLMLYNGLPLEPGEELALEEITIQADSNPLTALERYVDQVREKKHLVLKPLETIAGLWNYWVTFTEKENNAGAELKAMEYQYEKLLAYNIRSCPVGVGWHRDNAFFESRCKPHLGVSIAESFGRAAARFPDFHMCGGLFWGAVSECSDFFQQHPEAILRDKQGRLCCRGPEGSDSWTRCLSPSYYVDFSHPAAKAFFQKHLLDMKNEVDVKTFNIDFMGDHGEWKGAWAYLREDDNPFLNCDPYDAHLNRPFETDRVIPQTIRETLGPSVVIRSYTALFMRYLGLVDVVRTATDASRVEYGGELRKTPWDELRIILQNLAANYMFHGKWWWSDSCGLCVGTRPVPERTEEFRIRSLLNFVSGGPITLGDKVAQMTPEQFRYYTINLPVTGYAARPLDLFERTLPRIYHLPKAQTGFKHELLTLFNLTKEPCSFNLRLSNFGLKEKYLAFEFWTKELLRIDDGILNVTLPPLTARHYALHEDNGTPVVLGTDFHLSMGAMEISDTQWDEQTGTFSGMLRRPDEEIGHIYIWVPDRFDAGHSKVTGGSTSASGSILTLGMKASSVPVPWQVAFY